MSQKASQKTLVILFGPPAVGKMAVGQALSKLTGIPLFHNHLTIELVVRFFEFGSAPYNRLVPEFRRMVFEEVARSDLPGLIFTFVWALEEESDRRYIDKVCHTFTSQGAQVCFVELKATLDERLRRLETPERLAEKPSRRDIARARKNLLEAEKTYRMNSSQDFFYPDRQLVIDNTSVAPSEVAIRIIEHFKLPRAQSATG